MKTNRSLAELSRTINYKKVGRLKAGKPGPVKIKTVSVNKPKSKKRWDAIIARLPKDKEIFGAEIGVLNGNTAHRILKELPLLTHNMIDPWKPPTKSSDYYKTGDDNSRQTKEQFDKCYEKTKKLCAFAGKRAIYYRMKSETAAAKFEDKSLDFVFIDGDHSYNGVKKDIELWLPKIKSTGWIGGHDYDHPRLPGVKKAVDEMFPSDVVEFDVNRTWFVKLENFYEG